MRYTLEDIKSFVDELAAIIQAPQKLLPTYGNSREGHPNIVVGENGELSYEAFERGQEIKREYAFDVDHLLYIVFRDITFMMAVEYVSKHEEPNIDHRRLQFQMQLELLGKLNMEWQQKEKEYQAGLVIQFPFNDYEGKRQSYLRELMGNGFLYNEALQKAHEKFP